jgi:alkaline phosphatase D
VFLQPAAKWYRRALLTAGIVAGLSMPAFAANLRSGPMPGYPSALSAVIWLQADSEATARLEYWPDRDPGQRHLSRPVRLEAATDYAARIGLNDLTPGTHYTCRVVLDGIASPPGTEARFQTVTVGDPTPPRVTLAMGSCAYLPDPLPFEHWAFQMLLNGPWGDTYHIFDRLAAKRPDMMVWLGDNLYLRPQDVAMPQGMARRYWLHRGHPALQSLLRSTHHVALWDDHDMGWNNSDRHFWGRRVTTDLFKRYWANPGYGTPTVPGIFSVARLHDVDVFLLDDRTYRDADDSPDRPTKQMLGPAQLQWLQRELERSTATFKLIANGSQVLNDDGAYEGWHHFPNERNRFLSWLTEKRIPGVMFLSGDRHHTVMLKEDRPGSYPLYELTCSPLTSKPSTVLRPGTQKRMVPDTFVAERNFGQMAVDGALGDRRLTITICDHDGKALWSRIIRQQDLQ